MVKLLTPIVGLFLNLVVFYCECMTTLQRKLTDIEQSCLNNVKSEVDCEGLVDRFEGCISTPVDTTIRNALLTEVKKSTYARETIEFVIAKVEPYVECSKSLDTLLKSIPSHVDNADLILPIYGVLLEVALKKDQKFNKNLYMMFLKTGELLQQLQNNPVCFDSNHTFPEEWRQKQNKTALDFITWNWNSGALKKSIAAIFPILLERQFALVPWTESNYSFINKHWQIGIKLDDSDEASAITGPKLFTEFGIPPKRNYHSYKAQRTKYSIGSDIIHEVHHHIVRCIDKDMMKEGFTHLVNLLNKLGCDNSYLALLEKIWTNVEEFRNITSVFVGKEEIVYFDPLTEGAAVDFIRASHTDGVIENVPVALVNLIKDCVGARNITHTESGGEFKSWQ